MDQLDAQELFQQGLQAVRDEKDLNRGRKLLVQSLRLNPNNDMAWVWLSRATTDPQKRQECLERALQINPANQLALDLQRRSASGKPAPSSAAKISPSKTVAPKSAAKTDDSVQLGALLMTVETDIKQFLIKLMIMAFCLFLSFGLYVGLHSAASDDLFNLVVVIFAAIPLLGALYFLVLLVMSWGARVELYENGLVQFYGGSRRWRWDSFTEIRVQEQTTNYRYRVFFSSIPVATVHSFQLRLMAGRTRVIINKDFKNYYQATEVVLGRVLPLIFARHQQAFQRGETLQYGPIKLNREGIQQWWKKVTWDDLASWKVENGELMLWRRNKRRVQFSVSGIPNAHVLLKMIEYQRNR